MWNIRTMLESISAFLPTPAEGIGSIHYTEQERKKLAIKSREYVCKHCGAIAKHLDIIDER